MTPLALLFLVAAAGRLEVVSQVYSIPASDWRFIELNLTEGQASLVCDYEVIEPSRKHEGAPWAGGPVRIALVRRQDLERVASGLSRVLATAEPDVAGRFYGGIQKPGEYALVIDNRGETKAKFLKLRVSVLPVRQLPPGRRWAVVLFSLAVFLGLAFYSGAKLAQATHSSTD